jgi:hypothetical protein
MNTNNLFLLVVHVTETLIRYSPYFLLWFNQSEKENSVATITLFVNPF